VLAEVEGVQQTAAMTKITLIIGVEHTIQHFVLVWRQTAKAVMPPSGPILGYQT
jgi:hypothetical protein